jgi:hypothetical protein
MTWPAWTTTQLSKGTNLPLSYLTFKHYDGVQIKEDEIARTYCSLGGKGLVQNCSHNFNLDKKSKLIYSCKQQQHNSLNSYVTDEKCFVTCLRNVTPHKLGWEFNIHMTVGF